MVDLGQMAHAIRRLRSLEEAFYPLASQIAFTKYLLNPENLPEERDKFWSKFDRGHSYNPQYHYPEVPTSQAKAIAALSGRIPQIQKELETLQHNPLAVAFSSILQEDAALLDLLSVPRDDHFSARLTQLYGEPPSALLIEAERLLGSTPRNAEQLEPKIPSHSFAEEVRTQLRKNRLNWTVIEELGLGPRCSVVPIRREIMIKSEWTFTVEDLERFAVHEIGTHIFRSENGALQPLEMFRVGLRDYLPTEEGLATVMEERHHVMSHSLLRRYAGRAIASGMAMSAFPDIVVRLLDDFTREEAYEIAHRIKRGLADTSRPGGLTKDYAYLWGRSLVRAFDNKGGDLRMLFMGKISVGDVAALHPLVEAGLLVPPKYVPAGGATLQEERS